MNTKTLSSLLVVLSASTGSALGQTITVTTSADAVDVPTNATIADLPGPDGVVSLREALRASDNTPGHQTVGFAIPPSDWYLPTIFPGQVLLQGSFSWSAMEPVTIDGTTQTAFTGDTYPGGWEIVFYGLTLYLGGDGSEIFGIHGSDVGLTGSGSDAHDNTGGMYFSVFGSGNFIHDNEAGTISITYGSDNVVVRNTLQRVRVSGSAGTGLPAANNRIGGPDPLDRNFITGWGNYGEHGVPGGTTFELIGTDGTIIQNNYIGTTPDGMAIGNPASTVGIAMLNRNSDVTVRDNRIAARAVGVGSSTGAAYGTAIWIYGRGTGYDIRGNTMGLDAAGQPTLGGVEGVLIETLTNQGPQDLRMGGTGPGEGNVIAGHSSTGVLVKKAPGVAFQAITLSGNSIYGNGNIGIDLTPNNWTFGVTPNDPLDADEGANGLQNFPELTSATTQGSLLQVAGTLHSSPMGAFALELFASPACDASGHGQGRQFLGGASVTTDAAGDAGFVVTLTATVPTGWVVTATATSAPGATSEFSACVDVVDGSVGGNYCTSTPNSWSPAGAAISAFGSASLAANDLVLSAAGVPPVQFGLFFYGAGQQQTPFGNGFLCVTGTLFRLQPPTTSDSFGVASRAADYGAPPMDQGPGAVTAGSTWNFQYWFRDPAAGGASFNLSDGLTVPFLP